MGEDTIVIGIIAFALGVLVGERLRLWWSSRQK